ncbi:MAG: helix-turn-helix domain-containing protein [Pseudomonadota bacterium]
MDRTSVLPPLRAVQQRCSDCKIRHRAVCSLSGPQELAELDRIKFYRDFDPGQEIVGEGEPIDSLGSVVDGVVALHKTLEDGRRQMVGLMFASDFIGRPLRAIAPYDAIAVTKVRMCLFRRSKFEEVLSRQSSLEHRLLEMMLDELDCARDWMVLLGRKTAQERLASFLMILSRRSARLDKQPLMDGIRIEIPLTREAIAEYLGLTIETVSRQLTKLRKEGLIVMEDQRHIRIMNLARLAAITQDDPRAADEYDGNSTGNTGLIG